MSRGSLGASRIAALRVGLTGGVASGKSTVAQLFSALGVPVIDADQIAREVVAPGSTLLAEVVRRFGAQLLQPTGALDRAALRSIVFADPRARRELEALLHPAIRSRTEALAAAADGPYQIHMLPLLVETQAMRRYGRILVVDCGAALQLERLTARDGINETAARTMLAAQATRTERLAVADDVITNSGSIEDLRLQVATLHTKYLALAAA